MLYRAVQRTTQRLRLLMSRRVQDSELAFLCDGEGIGKPDITDRRGYYYAQFSDGVDASGNAKYSPPFPVRAAGVAFQVYVGCPVYVAYGRNDEYQIVEANYQALDQAGIDTRLLNPLNQQNQYVNLWQLTIAFCSAVATTANDSFLVTVKRFLYYVNNTFAFFETGNQADKLDLSAYVPATDMQCYAAVWVDTYTGAAEITTSTAQSLFTTLDDTDIQEVVAGRPPDAVPLKAFWLANDQGTITQSPVNDVDLRQFLNMPPVHGFLNPVAYRERIQADRQQLYAGTLEITGTLEILGVLVGMDTDDASGGGGSGAPTDATYLLQTASGSLPNAQAMASLATGLVKNTTTTGVQSIAVAGTDYTTPTGSEVLTNKTISSSTALLTAAAISRKLSANFTMPDTYSLVISDYFDENGFTLTLQGDASLEIL